nr:RNA polymerase sigma factor ShbA [Amycolatopsis benzoatilytica]
MDELDPLVRAAGRNDPAAVAQVLRLLQPVIVRYCRARIGGRDLSYLSADDVAQNACIAVLNALPAHHDRGGSFLHLVYAITANKIADAFRAAGRERADPVAELRDDPQTGNEPEAHALRLDLGSQLSELLGKLAPAQREILALRVIGGLSAGETAEALGISAGNVRVIQHRALTRLRGMLGEKEL